MATRRHPGRVRRLASRIRWFWRELTGESGYDRYVVYVRTHRPHAPVLSRREFERRRTDAADTDPRKGFRCC